MIPKAGLPAPQEMLRLASRVHSTIAPGFPGLENITIPRARPYTVVVPRKFSPASIPPSNV